MGVQVGDGIHVGDAAESGADAGAAVAPGARDGVAFVDGAAVAVGDDCAGNGVGVGARRAVGVGGALQAAMMANASVATAMARSGRGIATATLPQRRCWGQGVNDRIHR